MKEKALGVKGIQYLWLALLAFSGLGIEALYAFVLEPILYGRQISDWTVSQNILHWSITCITWGLITYGILTFARSRYGFKLFEKAGKVKLWQWLCVLLCVVISLGVSYWDWNGLKVVKEYQYNGALKFIFQYIYYVFETVLFSLILIFGQKAFDVWLRLKYIPFGGLVLAVTWGLIHIFTKGSITSGLLAAMSGLLFGIVYLLVHRDIKKALPIVFLMFVL